MSYITTNIFRNNGKHRDYTFPCNLISVYSFRIEYRVFFSKNQSFLSMREKQLIFVYRKLINLIFIYKCDMVAMFNILNKFNIRKLCQIHQVLLQVQE